MIINRIKLAAKVILGSRIAGREVKLFPDDVMVTSYPKSGNTWTRFLIANLITDKDVTFKNIEEIIPDIYQWGEKYLGSVTKPRVLKSHEYFDPRCKKIIYIVRDPRDVAVSYWYHQLKFGSISEGVMMDDFVDKFIAGKLDPFGSWGQNVGSWLGASEGDENFLLIRYEDLLKNSMSTMELISAFLNLNHSPERIAQAIERSSLSNMKSMEKLQASDWKVLNKKHHKKDMPFVRQGKEGGWKNTLSDMSAARMEQRWGTLMRRLGYLDK